LHSIQNTSRIFRFWYTDLIDKIGMNSMVIETDMAGIMWAHPTVGQLRDWAKFGLLYLHKGNWNGEQIFNESWVKYTTTPTNRSEGRYGGILAKCRWTFPDVPRDMYHCSGFQGQMVAIIPSLDLMIVRMGLKKNLNLISMEC
jgi:CubicO group peptidase (beta-lactamase class C family)